MDRGGNDWVIKAEEIYLQERNLDHYQRRKESNVEKREKKNMFIS